MGAQGSRHGRVGLCVVSERVSEWVRKRGRRAADDGLSVVGPYRLLRSHTVFFAAYVYFASRILSVGIDSVAPKQHERTQTTMAPSIYSWAYNYHF